MMKYRLTCLTPTLVGDGNKLSPIDYMVWKDHVNVLDQRRIFKLLARGPRLESYLTQLRKADKLDFASWGGFAQNFAGRRIPFENPSAAALWDKAHIENLHIPTFAAGPAGPYLPGSALKGALRSGAIFDRWTERTISEIVERAEEEGGGRRAVARAEDVALGSSGQNRMRLVGAADSSALPTSAFNIYLLRVSTLVAKGPGKYELGWKQTRGSVDNRRVDDSTPSFAEMTVPGTVFEGMWQERSFLAQPEIAKALHWKDPSRSRIFDAANRYAEKQLQLHKEYAEWTGMTILLANLQALEAKLALARETGGCLLSLGWGGGFLSKAAFLDTGADPYRRILKQIPFYDRAMQTGLPFPKTRRIVFLGNQPAALPGWTMLEVA